MTITDDIVTLAEAYADHTGLKLSTVSTYAERDGKWLAGLRAGTAGCTVRRARRAIEWFSDNWPADLTWPRDIPRPPKSPNPKEAA